MARNRMIKVEFWSDEKIGNLSLLARLLFIGIWNYSDDSGICRANPLYLKNHIFPYNNITLQRITGALQELYRSVLIIPVEYNSESYLLVKNFNIHQTINHPSNFRYIKELNDDYSSVTGVIQEDSIPKVKDKVKEKEKVKGWWGEFWNKYPRKQGKKDAEDYFFSDSFKIYGNIFNDIIKGIDKSIKTEQWQKNGGKYIPLPATFLRNERWKDEIEEIKSPYKTTEQGDKERAEAMKGAITAEELERQIKEREAKKKEGNDAIK